jgi:ABC-type thiamin/hydroxymethylpyrimidine transport system permease subunit
MKQFTNPFNMTDLQISAAKKTAKQLLTYVTAVVAFNVIMWFYPLVAGALLTGILAALLIGFLYNDVLEKLEREAKRRK